MIITCPCCNGLGYKPGALRSRKRKRIVVSFYFEARQCDPCHGSGTQYCMDPVNPYMPSPWYPNPIYATQPSTTPYQNTWEFKNCICGSSAQNGRLCPVHPERGVVTA